MDLNVKIAKAWDKYLTSEKIEYGYDINPEHFSFAISSSSISPETPETIDTTVLIDESGFHCRFSCEDFKVRADYIYEIVSLINRINDTVPYGKFILDTDYNEVYLIFDCFITVSSQLSNEFFDTIISSGTFCINRYYRSFKPFSSGDLR